MFLFVHSGVGCIEVPTGSYTESKSYSMPALETGVDLGPCLALFVGAARGGRVGGSMGGRIGGRMGGSVGGRVGDGVGGVPLCGSLPNFLL